ncbi:MAG: glycerol-3-phosphate 1-O-acyltransferase PlsY [Phycisphaeraceae bacterium]|nr:glycerol-3-phosphate 1-O-acyltransferase PlsY [Phycisphaerales bacterium]MCB9860089.1 glycerol-3-phosphate 1-O-acyltransferase PlsY [Phycisphaeraceae bacterium]
MITAVAIAIAFLSGSIPFGVIIARMHGINIREHGSKNIGATNVMRVVGKKPGALCFLLDVLKGFVPTLAGGYFLGALGASQIDTATAWQWLAVMVASVLGHMFSPFVGFKGGKGVATGLGSLLGVFPVLTVPAICAFGVFVVVLKSTMLVGISSCIAALSMPLFLLLGTLVLGSLMPRFDELPFYITLAGIAALVIYKHRGNLARTLAGTEPKFGSSAAPQSENAESMG